MRSSKREQQDVATPDDAHSHQARCLRMKMVKAAVVVVVEKLLVVACLRNVLHQRLECNSWEIGLLNLVY
jgi:hypothetical protein